MTGAPRGEARPRDSRPRDRPTAGPWTLRTLPELLAAHGLDGVPEQPLAHDGWSGATLTLLQRGTDRFVLKRTSLATDWIARHTLDRDLREACLAADGPALAGLPWAPYLGAAADGSDGPTAAILMPDLSGALLAWERPDGEPPVNVEIVDRVIDAMAGLHAQPWPERPSGVPGAAFPWCPLRARIELLSRPSAERYRAEGLAVGERFLAGWDAFDRLAPPPARDLLRTLWDDPSPALRALGQLPAAGLHGDLKLANVALPGDGRVALIDWQLATFAPVAVELGWFLVSNVALLPVGPDDIFARYRAAVGVRQLATADARQADARQASAVAVARASGSAAVIGDWAGQIDLAILVGLLLRGWRKALDVEAGLTLPTGATAAEDLGWWCNRAVEAARRQL